MAKRTGAAGLLLLGGLLAASLSRADEPVSVVGVYSNNVVTDEHARGYTVELWRQGDQYFGFFLSAMGTAEDIPLGVIEDLRLDSTTRLLTFKSKLSVGVTTMNGESWNPTRDLYQFEGTLFPDQMNGTVIHTDALEPAHPAIQEEVTLYRNTNAEGDLPRLPSYAVWTELARKMVQARGPKW